jgi:quercetin dioxygenase-like cupin family protein
VLNGDEAASSFARMTTQDVDVPASVIRRFELPDEMRQFRKGCFRIVRLGGLTIGRAEYEPGWRWSAHIGPSMGESHCSLEHVGMVLSGRLVVVFDDGETRVLRAGDLFHIPPTPHDCWVDGDEPYVSLHFLSAGEYALPREDDR